MGNFIKHGNEKPKKKFFLSFAKQISIITYENKSIVIARAKNHISRKR